MTAEPPHRCRVGSENWSMGTDSELGFSGGRWRHRPKAGERVENQPAPGDRWQVTHCQVYIVRA